MFALVAESLGQSPSSIYNEGSKNGKSDQRAVKTAAVQSATGATYQPQGIPKGEKSVRKVVRRSGSYEKVDAKAAEKRRKEWVRRLGAVFDVSLVLVAFSTRC